MEYYCLSAIKFVVQHTNTYMIDIKKKREGIFLVYYSIISICDINFPPFHLARGEEAKNKIGWGK